MPNHNNQLNERIQFLFTRLFLVFLPIYTKMFEMEIPDIPDSNSATEEMLENYASQIDNLIAYAFIPPILNNATSDAISSRLAQLTKQFPQILIDSKQFSFWDDSALPHCSFFLPRPDIALACDLIKQLLSISYQHNIDLLPYLPTTIVTTKKILLTLYELQLEKKGNSPNSMLQVKEITAHITAATRPNISFKNRKSSLESALRILQDSKFTSSEKSIISKMPQWIRLLKEFKTLWEHDNGTKIKQQCRELVVRFLHELGYIEPYMTAKLLGIDFEQTSAKQQSAFMMVPLESLFKESKELFAAGQNISQPVQEQQNHGSINPGIPTQLH